MVLANDKTVMIPDDQEVVLVKIDLSLDQYIPNAENKTFVALDYYFNFIDQNSEAIEFEPINTPSPFYGQVSPGGKVSGYISGLVIPNEKIRLRFADNDMDAWFSLE
jgi:hypothetical protein